MSCPSLVPPLLPALLVSMLLSFHTLPCSASQAIYTQPLSLNMTLHTWASPTTPIPTDSTQLVFWHMGPTLREATWNLSSLTGLAVPPALWAQQQRGVPGASVSHPTGSSVQFYNGTFGAWLNTYENPPIGVDLSTIIISNDWAAPVYAWPAACVHVVVDIAVAQGSKDPSSAIYVTTSFGLHHYNAAGQPDAFVWYETSIFDLQRSQSEWVRVDTFSKQAIIHGVLAGPGSSRYHAQSTDSSNSSSAVFPDFRHFDFRICGNHLSQGLADVNAQLPAFQLPTDVARWAVTHVNFELEALEGAQAGYALRGWQIVVE